MSKVTAARLARVEEAQEALALACDLLDELVLQEKNGWQPGLPASVMTARAEPLGRLAKQAREMNVTLDRLYR